MVCSAKPEPGAQGQEADGRTCLGYNDPQWLAERHEVGPRGETATAATRPALEAIAEAATSSGRP